MATRRCIGYSRRSSRSSCSCAASCQLCRSATGCSHRTARRRWLLVVLRSGCHAVWTRRWSGDGVCALLDAVGCLSPEGVLTSELC